ncbi:MAG: NAD-dependent epimerase/dehydratase family protein [Chlamydiales bacterium]|nr:NAD-dependent epimerase/dehydratase family protein [Chlamydiales bacterium]
MRIFVTGASGFIGSHLVRYHRERGDEVREADLATRQELLSWEGLPDAIKWAEGVYHMAAVVGQKKVLAHPIEVLKDNIYTCDRILETAAAVNPSCRILVASSSEVYRYLESPPPFKEKSSLAFPSGEILQLNYPLSKYVNEASALSYVKEKGLHVVVARLFNTIGPGQTGRYGMVFPRFVAQAIKNEPITIFGEGSQSRAFCYVGDTVSILHQLLVHPKTKGEIFNVGNDTEEISILELAKRVIAVTGSRSEIQFLSYEEAYGMPFEDTMRRSPDLNKLKGFIQLPSFQPIEKTIEETASFLN